MKRCYIKCMHLYVSAVHITCRGEFDDAELCRKGPLKYVPFIDDYISTQEQVLCLVAVLLLALDSFVCFAPHLIAPQG